MHIFKSDHGTHSFCSFLRDDLVDSNKRCGNARHTYFRPSRRGCYLGNWVHAAWVPNRSFAAETGFRILINDQPA
jgi:hypothetical protein